MKDKIPENDKNSVVYKIECNDCNSCYIGETGRQLHTRITEHKSYVRNFNARSQIVEHVTTHGHSFNWDSASVIDTHKHDKCRRILEACHTHTTQNTLNRAIDIPTTYVSLVHKILGN